MKNNETLSPLSDSINKALKSYVRSVSTSSDKLNTLAESVFCECLKTKKADALKSVLHTLNNDETENKAILGSDGRALLAYAESKFGYNPDNGAFNDEFYLTMSEGSIKTMLKAESVRKVYRAKKDSEKKINSEKSALDRIRDLLNKTSRKPKDIEDVHFISRCIKYRDKFAAIVEKLAADEKKAEEKAKKAKKAEPKKTEPK